VAGTDEETRSNTTWGLIHLGEPCSSSSAPVVGAFIEEIAMTDESQSYENQVALFRYGLIADLIHLPRQRGSGLEKKLKQKAGERYCIPGSRRTKVAIETMRDWLGLYRKGGYDALKPKPRSDTGTVRRLPQDVVDLLIHIKEEHRDYTVPMVVDEARKTDGFDPALALPLSTVHRILARAGVMGKRPEDPTSLDRRHFAYAKAGELWMSDVMHGPSVVVDGRRKHKTYLVALLDDATRVIPFAAFALSENTQALLAVLEQAIRRRGIPKRLYVDNGSAFRSTHLSLVCARLGITLVHARPYQPQGKGKQERWFRTARMQLLPLLGDADLASLNALNRRLWGWVEGEYHQRPHKGLDGKTPLDAWATSSDEVVLPGPELDLRELFLFEDRRKVARDRTVSLRGVLYEVDALLVGETVTLRFDPARPKGPVDVWHRGKKLQTARPVDAYANCFVKRNHETKMLEPSQSPDVPAATLRMRDLAETKKKEGP
jgi:putative transposase